jgi:lactoylglutathione lyase
MAETFMADGFQVVGQPRLTGDGYYEAVVLDPEGNVVEITI